MSGYVRQDINGSSPLDMKNLNDNMRYLWMKVFGDINMSDIQSDIKNMLYTNWLQPQGEGNLDASHPLYIRFYIPPNTKKIKSAFINVMTSRYRVDSDVALTVPATNHTTGSTSGPSSQTTAGQSTIESSGASSISTSGQTTNTTSGGGGALSVSSTSQVKDWKASGGTGWGTPTAKIPGDFGTIVANGTMLWVNAHKVDSSDPNVGYFIDLFDMNHRHDFSVSAGDHYHNISHQHDISHNHNIAHTHNISHTHEVNISFDIPAHGHDLNMAIKEADVAPNQVKCYINEQDLNISLSGDNQVQNDIDILDKLTIGGWNIIKFTASNVARITAYGIIELLQDY